MQLINDACSFTEISHPCLVKQAGFTISELVVTLAIIGILAGGATVVLKESPLEAHQGIANERKALLTGMHTMTSQLISDGTHIQAMALGLPPDTRGVIDATSVHCMAPNCPPGIGDGWHVRLDRKTLRVTGALETISSAYIPSHQNAGTEEGNMNYISVYPNAFIANPTALVDVDITTSPCLALEAVSQTVFQGNTWLPVEYGTQHRTHCYANGTCDPVTYLSRTYGHLHFLRSVAVISVSSTGSIQTAINAIPKSWSECPYG